MNKFMKSILLGMAAGIIDIIPMIFIGLGWEEVTSAFLHWVGLGILITFARLPFNGWLSGLIIALVTGIPIAVLTLATDPMAWLSILTFSVLLGSALGYMSEKLINNPMHR